MRPYEVALFAAWLLFFFIIVRSTARYTPRERLVATLPRPSHLCDKWIIVATNYSHETEVDGWCLYFMYGTHCRHPRTVCHRNVLQPYYTSRPLHRAYVYALHHGARTIFISSGPYRLDDLNRIAAATDPVPVFRAETAWVNPYPHLGATSFAWVSGFPVQLIRDSRTYKENKAVPRSVAVPCLYQSATYAYDKLHEYLLTTRPQFTHQRPVVALAPGSLAPWGIDDDGIVMHRACAFALFEHPRRWRNFAGMFSLSGRSVAFTSPFVDRVAGPEVRVEMDTNETVCVPGQGPMSEQMRAVAACEKIGSDEFDAWVTDLQRVGYFKSLS